MCVCVCVRAFFSPEIVQAGAAKGLKKIIINDNGRAL